MTINRRGFVLLGSAAGIVAPFVAKAKSLMGLRGPTLYTGPTIKIALVRTEAWADGVTWRAVEVYDSQRVVELPFSGQAAFGGRITHMGVTGLMVGFGGDWPAAVGDVIERPWHREKGKLIGGDRSTFNYSFYSPEEVRKIAENIVVKGEGVAKVEDSYFYLGDDGKLYRTYRVVEEM